jgi:thiamine pyrophosphokinase
MSIPKNDYKYISFFSLNDDTMISLSGMKYNIENYNLKIDDNLCLSNEIITQCEVITNDYILIIESN